MPAPRPSRVGKQRTTRKPSKPRTSLSSAAGPSLLATSLTQPLPPALLLALAAPSLNAAAPSALAAPSLIAAAPSTSFAPAVLAPPPLSVLAALSHCLRQKGSHSLMARWSLASAPVAETSNQDAILLHEMSRIHMHMHTTCSHAHMHMHMPHAHAHARAHAHAPRSTCDVIEGIGGHQRLMSRLIRAHGIRTSGSEILEQRRHLRGVKVESPSPRALRFTVALVSTMLAPASAAASTAASAAASAASTACLIARLQPLLHPHALGVRIAKVPKGASGGILAEGRRTRSMRQKLELLGQPDTRADPPQGERNEVLIRGYLECILSALGVPMLHQSGANRGRTRPLLPQSIIFEGCRRLAGTLGALEAHLRVEGR